MNAADEIYRLLHQHKAVLVRQNKHLVFRLSNGQNFVMAKTPGDPVRAARNSLAELRRALGVVRAAPSPKGAPPMEELSAPVVMRQLAPPDLELKESLKQRLESAIACAEQEQEALLTAAQRIEQRVQILKALLPFADDPATEEALRGILPAVEPPAPLPPPQLPEPPQRITERVQVTRHLVLAATQTFDGTFTVNDVMALMTGGRIIDGQERLRVRSSIALAMMTLYERGELIREAEGLGKRQAIWMRAPLNGGGLGTRA